VFVKIFQNLSPIKSIYIENKEIFNFKQFSKFAFLLSHVREDLRPSPRRSDAQKPPFLLLRHDSTIMDIDT
jgi:hypothetical protein